MGTTGSDTGSNPFIFCYLLLDGKMKVRIGLANAKDMPFRSLNPNRMSSAFMDFNVIWCNKLSYFIYVSRIDYFLNVTTN